MNTCFQTLKEIEKYLLASGVTEHRLNKIRNLFEVLGDESEIIFRAIIDDLLLHEYREFQEIWQLLTEEQWLMYDTLGLTEIREQLLLFYAKRNLKKAFVEKVCKYGKKKKAWDEDYEEDPF